MVVREQRLKFIHLRNGNVLRSSNMHYYLIFEAFFGSLASVMYFLTAVPRWYILFL